MSKIISIGTSVPQYRHRQDDILGFMQGVYCMNEGEKRKLKFLYHQSQIETRYSVIPDYSLSPAEWVFYPPTENLEPFPNVDMRMQWFNRTAPALSQASLEQCLDGKIAKEEITHLITVTCTGLSAPGLDLQMVESMNLRSNISRTSVNFMGCYAAIHAMKLADNICRWDKKAKVAIVCTELCTLHFQNKNSPDNISASLLFGDGSASMIITHDDSSHEGIGIKNFYSEVALKGKPDMSWQVSSTGFLMQLSGYIPDLIEEDFSSLLTNAINEAGIKKDDIQDWALHPGGKKILMAIQKSVGIEDSNLKPAYDVLRDYGNMSSPTILFVLKEILEQRRASKNKGPIFGAAFGPGLTLETFILQ